MHECMHTHTHTSTGRPQTSYATVTDVTINWRPPADAIGKELFQYHVQFCVVDPPTSTDPLPDEATAGKWQDIPNPGGRLCQYTREYV